jgi:hypothetical protein
MTLHPLALKGGAFVSKLELVFIQVHNRNVVDFDFFQTNPAFSAHFKILSAYRIKIL